MKPISFQSFQISPKGFVSQWVDVQEVANNNVSMQQAREMSEHRFAVVRQSAQDTFSFHVKAARASMKSV